MSAHPARRARGRRAPVDPNFDALVVQTVAEMRYDGIIGGWASAEDVALALDVSRDTARRHLNALVVAGTLATNMPFGTPTGPSPRMYHVAPLPRADSTQCACGHEAGDHSGMHSARRRGRYAFSACGACECQQWRPKKSAL